MSPNRFSKKYNSPLSSKLRSIDRPLDDKLEHPAKILLARVRRIRVKARNLKATFFTESNRPVSAEAIAGANNDCAVISGELERTLGMSTVS